MAIIGQQILTIGTENQPTGSETLFSAFNKVQNNFNNLFSCASSYSTFLSGDGIHVTSNPTTGTVTVNNTGVLNLYEGTGVTLSGQNGNITISATGTGSAAGVTRIGLISPHSTLQITGGPIVSAGNIAVDLPNIPVSSDFVSGTYTAPTLFVDPQGRITKIADTIGVGTVTSIAVENGGGLQITGSPITSSGTINIKNMGVTSITNGGGLDISGTTGDITIAATNQNVGTVTSVEVTSTSLVVTGSPITTSGPITIDLPATTLVGNIRVTGNANIGVANISNLLVNGNASVSGNLIVSSDTTITGNLTVNGTTTTVNSTVVTVNDKNLVLANNQTTSDGANGSGLTIGSEIATFNYSNVSNGWVASNTITATGNLIGGNIITGGFANITGNIYINSVSDSTGGLGSASGGALQIAGGISVQKNVYVAGNTTASNITTRNLILANASIGASGAISWTVGTKLYSTSSDTKLEVSGSAGANLNHGSNNYVGVNASGAFIKTNNSSTWNFYGNGNMAGPSSTLGVVGNITAGNVNVGAGAISGNDFTSINSVVISSTSDLFFNAQNNNGSYVAFAPPLTMPSSTAVVWALPNAEGSANSFLSTDGAGILSFKKVARAFTPASSTAAGIPGDITYDSSHIYVCVGATAWIRINATTNF